MHAAIGGLHKRASRGSLIVGSSFKNNTSTQVPNRKPRKYVKVLIPLLLSLFVGVVYAAEEIGPYAIARTLTHTYSAPDAEPLIGKDIGAGEAVHVAQKRGNWARIDQNHRGWIKLEDFEGQVNAIAVGKMRVYDRPDGVSNDITLQMGESVHIVEKRGEWARIDQEHLGWVRIADLIEKNQFQPVKEWKSPGPVEAGAGDWTPSYVFHRDGTWSLTAESQDENERRIHVKEHGKLYRYKNIIWAERSEDSGLYSGSIFYIRENGKVCWQGYMADNLCQ
jgi:hypothetical protein